MSSAIGDALTSISPYLGVIGTLFGIGDTLFGGSSVSMPKLQMPQVQNFQIPQADLQQLNSQISQNTQLSDSARQTALDAINSYNQGQLSSAYAGQYEQQYNQAKQQVLQQLAAQGFTAGSTQYTNAMQNLQTWASNLKSQMLQQQLQAGLQTAGLSDKAIQDLESSWTTQSGINAQNNAANIEGTNVSNQAQLGLTEAELQRQQLSNQKMSNVMQGVSGLAGAVKGLGGSNTTQPTSTDTIGQFSSNPLGYQTPQSDPTGAAGYAPFTNAITGV